MQNIHDYSFQPAYNLFACKATSSRTSIYGDYVGGKTSTADLYKNRALISSKLSQKIWWDCTLSLCKNKRDL